MNDQKTDALVIRLADFSNTSRVVTFFTRDFGKVSAIAKGGKRLKGPFESALDLLARADGGGHGRHRRAGGRLAHALLNPMSTE